MSTPTVSTSRRRRRPGSTDPLARALRWLRWPAVIAWVLAIVALNPLSSSLSKVTNNDASAYLPSAAGSTRVAEIQQAAQPVGKRVVDQVVVVFSRGGRLTAADAGAVATARTAVGRLAGSVRGLSAPGAPLPSADGKAILFTAAVATSASSENATDTTAVQSVRRVADLAVASVGGGLRVAVTGSAAIVADSAVSSKTLTDLRLTALAIIVAILLLVYRRPVLWLLPLFGAIGAIVVAQAGAYGLATAGITVSSLSASILIVLVLGAASDYALLLIHRYRQELRHYGATEEAMAVALRRTLPTLLASAGTVTCAMLCLLVAQSASLHGLGPVGAVAIASALLAQTTLLPALLLVLGRAAFWPRAPRAEQVGREQSRIWSAVGARVARRPAPVALVAMVLLGTACLGLAALQTANSPTSIVKGHPGSVFGEQLLAEHYPSGLLDPLVVLAPAGESSAAVSAARGTEGVASVTPGGPLGGYASYAVTLAVPPYGQRGSAAIQDLRNRLSQAAPGSLVGGGPAVQYDISRAARRDSQLLIPLVLAVILIVIALLLRAVVAPLVLVATTALSFGASFGLSNLLWRYGLGYPGIEAQIPLYIFIFLVALGVDYNIFLSARIREETREAGTRHGILSGLGVTGGVITAAGVILAATFVDLARLPQVPVAEVGIAVAIGVLLDTMLVRTVLVPAAFLSIGPRIWWPASRRDTKVPPPAVNGRGGVLGASAGGLVPAPASRQAEAVDAAALRSDHHGAVGDGGRGVNHPVDGP